MWRGLSMCCVAPLSRGFVPCTPIGLTVPTPSDAARSASDGCAFGMPTSRVTTTTIQPRAKPAGCLRLETKDTAVSPASARLVMMSPRCLLYKMMAIINVIMRFPGPARAASNLPFWAMRRGFGNPQNVKHPRVHRVSMRSR